MKLSRKHRTSSSLIDLAPMTDMVFQVLLFFIISSSFVVEPGIKINLPKSQTSELQVHQKMMITIDESQQIFIDKKHVDLENLEQKINLIKDNENGMSFRQLKDKFHVSVGSISNIIKRNNEYMDDYECNKNKKMKRNY